ncbi:hypothetical protein B0F90DRAFT_717163 [Multifurca ochricompacta]|uniref:Uncharacterized protein n=1 Tax=Multifurca ochricompacta TaxID=376703 RepID=A0AAD4M248_9AGAM|nr:hypothetical protein B0F90DRAFT_717163 [Multifurca ochricompacta]
MSTSERSLSRGRGLQQSTGRGGVGNIRSPSIDRSSTGPDDYSDTRGRDPIPSRDLNEVISTGRGGAGNIRSPSRDASYPKNGSVDLSPVRSENRGRGYDQDVISAIDSAYDTGVHSSGRGGLGNITRQDSRSRSRSREPIHSSGRGGSGNMHLGELTEKDILEVDETERANHHLPPGLHSIGRGGLANLTLGELPSAEGAVRPHGANHPHATHAHEFESTGRGGAGNISSSRSPSRDPQRKDHGLTGFLHRVGHIGAHKDEHRHDNQDEFLVTGLDTRQPAL